MAENKSACKKSSSYLSIGKLKPRRNGNYQDIKGFCKSVIIEEVKEKDYVLTPGRYVGLPDEEDDFDFKERFTKLKGKFLEQLKEEERINELILENLRRIKLKDEE